MFLFSFDFYYSNVEVILLKHSSGEMFQSYWSNMFWYFWIIHFWNFCPAKYFMNFTMHEEESRNRGIFSGQKLRFFDLRNVIKRASFVCLLLTGRCAWWEMQTPIPQFSPILKPVISLSLEMLQLGSCSRIEKGVIILIYVKLFWGCFITWQWLFSSRCVRQ